MSRGLGSKWLLVAFVWAMLVAPTPGAVGSCDDGDLEDPVDFSYYCRNREELACVRRFLRRELTEGERDGCRLDAVDACRRRAFPSDCRPSRRTAEACLNALRSLDTLETPEDELDECNTSALCRATPGELGDGGLTR
jgi:hypothetical protein